MLCVRLPTHAYPWALRLWLCRTVLQRPSLRVRIVPLFYAGLSLRISKLLFKNSRKEPRRRCAPLFCAFTPNVRRQPRCSYPYVLEVSATVAAVIDRVGHDTPTVS
jgi:hypothetical protein